MIISDLEKEAEMRLEQCRMHKSQWELDMRESYWFTAPHRARSVSSRTAVTTKPHDAGECNISFAAEMSQDFATMVMNTFMPEAEPWAGRECPLGTPDAVKQQCKDQIQAADAMIFEALSSSNFYAECGTAFNPDLSIGTTAMWVDDTGWSGIACQAIPLHELEIATGPTGHIDDRFFVQHVKYGKLRALLGDLPLPPEVEKNIKEKSKTSVEVRRGFWRDWNEHHDIVWQYVVMVGKYVVKHNRIKGAGSCPLIVGRFNPMKEWAWGNGPTIQSLPDLRHLDDLAAKKILNCEMSLTPPIAFPDDSIGNLEEGIEGGMAYAIRPGSENAIKNLYTATPPNVAIYDRGDIEQRIKRMHFLDFPDQPGKTPPTATQWLDQMTMAQRRVGLPGSAFWREFCAEVFLRYEYILQRKGIVKPITYDNKHVSLMPMNPAHKASEQQDVAQFARYIQLAGEAFPEEFKVQTNGEATLKNLVEKMGVSKIVVFRKPDEIKNAVSQIQQLQGGQAPNAPEGAANAGQQAPIANPAGAAPPQLTTQLKGYM